MDIEIIGVLHLGEFPKPSQKKQLEEIKQRSLADLLSLQSGGVDAVIIENEFDGKKSPYGEFLNSSQRKTMFDIVAFLRSHVNIPLGFCVLLNDYKTAFLLSKKFGGKFIRLDTFVDKVERISDGIRIIPFPEKILAFRKKIGAEDVEIWADVHVKHTRMLDARSLENSAKLALKNKASRIIITGDWTGKPPKISDLSKMNKILSKKLLVIGSGVDQKNISRHKKYASSVIIGSAFKKNGRVEIKKVRAIVKNKSK